MTQQRRALALISGGLDSLRWMSAREVADIIQDEHPQTIALILSHLPPSQAADIISGLPGERQLSVIRRVATMGQTSPGLQNTQAQGFRPDDRKTPVARREVTRKYVKVN